MKKIYFLLFTFLIGSLGFSQELLINGDFESWDDINTPSGYTTVESVEQESVEVNGGNFSAKVAATATRDLGQTISGIVPGNSYTISLWYKVESGDGTDARIWSFWRSGTTNLPDNVNELRGPNNAYFDTNGNVWTQYSVTLTAPATADGFYFEVRTYNGGTVYWDDFSFFAEASTGEPALVISSPTEGSTETSSDTEVTFIVSNFDVANGTGDGHIHYTIDGGSVIMKYDTDPIQLSGLSDGPHTVYMELVDNAHQPIVPAVNATLNFTTQNIIQSLPYTESFDYSVGTNLNDQPFWINNFTGDDVIINADNLSYSTLSGAGNSVSFDGSGADPVVEFTPTNTGTVYSSFMLKITSIPATFGNGYFAILRSSTGNYISRLFVSPVNETQYKIGISGGAVLNEITDATFNLDDTIFVVFNYDLDNNIVNAWVNPVLGIAEPVADLSEASGSTGNTLSQFMIRQDNATNTPFIVMDELRIATTWAEVTPTTLSNDEFNVTNFKIYPNPTSTGFVNITSTNADAMSVAVYDVLGKQVINTTINNNRLDVSSLNTGLYVVKISQNNATITKKLIIE